MSTQDNHREQYESEEQDAKSKVTYFGLTDFRGINEKFGIRAEDRTRHMYVIGKTGMGKSTLLENMAIQDIQNGEGLCFIDPHGTTAEKLLKYVPEDRIGDVVYFAPFDTKYPVALNILEHVDEDYRHLVASGLMDTFKKVFGEDVFSGRMVYLLNNAILSLLENEGESLMGINRIFSDKEYRKKIVSNVKDPAVLSFWRDEFAKYEDRYVKEATAAIQNKIGQFIMTPMIRNIVGQAHTSFDVRKIMDEKKILICNFSIGQTGSENVNLIGSLLITKIYLAAMSRANLSEENLKNSAPFYFYVDEFQNFVNDSFAQILSQARKYNLGLVIAHQYIDQLSDNVRSAVFGNVGSMITFRVGANDAEILEKEFAPQFTADDIVNLGARQIYLRLSIEGVGSKPFSAKTMPPIENVTENYVPAIVAHSRIIYGKEKKLAEADIQEWYLPVLDAFTVKKIEEKNNEMIKSILKDAVTPSGLVNRAEDKTFNRSNSYNTYNGDRNETSNRSNSYKNNNSRRYEENSRSSYQNRPTKEIYNNDNRNQKDNVQDETLNDNVKDFTKEEDANNNINNNSNSNKVRRPENRRGRNNTGTNTALRDALEAAIALDVRKENDWENIENKNKKSIEESISYKNKIKEKEELKRNERPPEDKEKEELEKRRSYNNLNKRIDNISLANNRGGDNSRNSQGDIDDKLKKLLNLED
ncbi:MAG: hypothetical protein QG614_12 [Patescibacteria group bacterium]|nr:hypothetical protein [Patescibacteria group bacterium]